MRDRVAGRVRDIIFYEPGKPVDELERELGIASAVKLASNENPLGPSPRALEAVREALGEVNRYPDGSGYHLKGALAEYHGLSREHFILGNGTNEVLEIIAHAFLEQGDEAVIAEGAFIVFQIVAQLVDARRVLVPLKDYAHDLKAMRERVGPRTKLLFVANPNNPTGTAVGEGDLRELLEGVPQSVIVVVDEAYSHYVARSDYPDATSWVRDYPNLLALRTFSKAYGLAGLRVGYGVGDPELVGYMNRVREPFNVNSLALVAARAALSDEEHVRKSVEVNSQGRDYLCRELGRLGVPCVPSQANFLLVEVGDGADCFRRLLREGVIVRPLGGYGLPQHVRVTVGLPEENERFIEALRKVKSGRA